MHEQHMVTPIKCHSITSVSIRSDCGFWLSAQAIDIVHWYYHCLLIRSVITNKLPSHLLRIYHGLCCLWPIMADNLSGEIPGH